MAQKRQGPSWACFILGVYLSVKRYAHRGSPLQKAGSDVCVCWGWGIPPFVSSNLGSPFIKIPSKASPTSCLHLPWLWIPSQGVIHIHQPQGGQWAGIAELLCEVHANRPREGCVAQFSVHQFWPSSDKDFAPLGQEEKLARPVGVETSLQLICPASLGCKLTHLLFLEMPLHQVLSVLGSWNPKVLRE